MLMDKEFEPDLRSEFVSLLKVKVGSKITTKNLGQQPKHFTEGYQGEQFFITKQMMDVWEELDADNKHSIKKVLSGPVGVGNHISLGFSWPMRIQIAGSCFMSLMPLIR